MQIVKGMVPYGAVAHGRDRPHRAAAQGARARSDPDRAWMEEWSAMADRVAKVGRHGRGREARHHRRQPLHARRQLLLQRRALHSARRRRSSRCIARRCAASTRRWSGCIRRSNASKCPTRARACRPISSSARARAARRTVVLFDGMDNAKEMSVIFAGLDFAKRGINTLAIDGPGQSRDAAAARHLQPSRLRGRRHAPPMTTSPRGPRSIRQARRGHGLQLRRLSRAAHRRASTSAMPACVAFGAMHWDMHAWQADIKAKLAADPKTSFSSVFQFRWVLGAPDNATALEWAKKFTLEGVAQQIECPFLILHGETDRIVPLESAKILYEQDRREEQDAEDLHRRRRRNRALPGRSPPARRRLYRRLDPRQHLTGGAFVTANRRGRRNRLSREESHARHRAIAPDCLYLPRRPARGTGAELQHLSGPGDPPGRRLRAGRRHRHHDPPGHGRSAGGARPDGHRREQAGRQRIHRLEPRRLDRSRRLYTAGCGKRARHQPGAAQEIKIAVRSAHAI